MVLTKLNSPPPKVMLLAVAGVIILHAVTAIALMMVQTPAPVTVVPKVIPPIEIELITIVDDIEQPVIEEIKVEPVKPVKQPQIVKDAKPVTEAKPKAVEPFKPLAKPITPPVTVAEKQKPNVEKTIIEEPDTVSEPIKTQVIKDKIIVKEPVIVKQQILVTNADEARADAEKKARADADAKARVDAQNKARADADAKARVDAQNKARADADAKARVDAQNKARADADDKARIDAQNKARADADAKARADAEREKAKAADNTPVNFTVSNGDWQKKPNFELSKDSIDRANGAMTYSLVLALSIDKSGRITNVSIRKSSGDNKVDRTALRQARSGSFKASTVNRSATLPLNYAVTQN